MPRTKKSAKGANFTLSQDQTKHAPAADPVASVGDHVNRDDVTNRVAPLAPTIAEIKHWHRQRVFAMDQRKRSDLALGAFMRTQLGWSRSLPKADADKIAKHASDIVALGEKVAKGKATGIGDSTFGQWSTIILASIHGRAHWDAIESAATKEMESLASSLPVWAAFGEGVKGFGPRSLAVIIGEAGDIGSYASVAKLWKRMGLAVMNGVRQGGLRKTASADEWVAHGYSARRRSYMFVIGDVLVKNKGAYRDCYLARKEYEREQAKVRGLIVVPAAKIPAARKHEFISDGHVHKRSQRYMEKRLLRDLWRAWRRACSIAQTSEGVPAAISSAQAERSAIVEPPPKASVPSATHSAQAEPSTTAESSPNLEASKVLTRQTRDRVKPIATSSGKKRPAGMITVTKPKLPDASIPAKAGKRRASHALSPEGRMPAAKSNERVRT